MASRPTDSRWGEFEQKKKYRSLVLLQGIMVPSFLKEHFMSDVLKWENLIRDYIVGTGNGWTMT